jgi:hypothetical protein
MTDGVQFGGIAIAGSVGIGGKNRPADVVLVQQLLNIARSMSLSVGQSALKIDGIAGPLTNAAISKLQKSALGFSDGRVDPGGQTMNRLNAMAHPAQLVQLAASPGQALVGAPPASARMSPLQAAMEAVPRARMWIGLAQVHLGSLRQGLLLSNGIVIFPAAFAVVNTHFHLDQDSDNLFDNLVKLSTIFSRISLMLNDPNRFFREGASTEKSKFADAQTGGFSSSKASDVITFRSEYPDCGPMCRTAMIIHEGAHYCGGPGEIIHFAHEFPKFHGEPQDGGGNNYENMPTSEAMRNAASYAAFAIHTTFSQDLRFGLDTKDT